MIPLSRWLHDRESGPHFAFSSDAGGMEADGPPVGSFDPPEQASQSRELQLEDALQAAEEALADERQSRDQRERRLREELGEDLALVLKNHIDVSLQSMQRELEAAIASILQPFLKEQSTSRAAAALIGLIEAELGHESQPLLELRAPCELHDAIRPSLERLNLPISLSEGWGIELAFTSRTARFEQLAARWHDIIGDLHA